MYDKPFLFFQENIFLFFSRNHRIKCCWNENDINEFNLILLKLQIQCMSQGKISIVIKISSPVEYFPPGSDKSPGKPLVNHFYGFTSRRQRDSFKVIATRLRGTKCSPEGRVQKFCTTEP